ncbi:MAG: isopentenyl-diphosphate Delta-isomerase [Phycisphaerales bacterium]|nr:isopentenyl-diphosphate Delta-isomerase [Phycisphaerales bacterium]
MEQVILVDEHDSPIGVEEKLRAHQNGGRLHRAFSIFVFNGREELLLQQRATQKYHFGGLWSNTCCGHPRPDESLDAAAKRRLREEFGFETDLQEQFAFIYEAHDAASGLTEHEFLHVFVGRFDGKPSPTRSEIDAWRWTGLKDIRRDLQVSPLRYTPWFRIAIEKLGTACEM